MLRVRSPVHLIGLMFVRVCELGVLALVVVATVGAAVYVRYSQDLPDPATLGTHRPFETTRIYARDGTTLLYELFDGGQRTVIPYSDIPWALKAATVAVEDARFFNNPGFDIRGIVRAFYLNREGEVVSGGSTITQQLVRGVLLSPEERGEQSYRRKIREAILAFKLSRQYSKEQILAMYLNEVYYGNMAYGVEAAAQSYFGHSAQTLNLAEASLLAGLPQSPTLLNPLTDPVAAKARQQIVLDLMVKEGYIDRAQAAAAYAQTIPLRPARVDIRYPHWVFYVRDLLEQQYGPELVYRGGLRVVTTLDPALQDLAERAAREQVANLADRDAHNAAVVVMDPRTTEILAMVGSVDYNDSSIDGQVNVALAERQPGSTLKPLVYAAALNRDWTPATIIWDTPTDFGGGYKPQNYDEQFRGPQRLRLALAGSLNIPAVKALQHVGLDAFLDLAHRMGITTLQDRDQYGLAVALGAGEVRLLDLTAAYSTFANGGMARPPVALLRVTSNSGAAFDADAAPPLPVFGNNSAQVSYLITSILSDNAARTPIFGPDSVMRLADDRPAAVKTGTSNDWKDSWAVGYTTDLVVGAWVGNNDNTPMAEVAGANGGGEIWRAIMEAAHAGKPVEQFERPPGIVEAEICAATGSTAGDCGEKVPEVFLAAHTPDQDQGQYVTVTVGGDGTCLATDATPLDQRRAVTFLLPPPDVGEWATASNLPRPPSVPCATASNTATTMLSTAPSVAAISSPDPGSVVGGQVTVRGSAAGQYILSYGAGATPTSWTTIVSGVGGVANGLLGVWTTDALAAGDYTLRLIVALPGSPEQETRVGVRIDNASVAVRLTHPPPDAVVRQDAAVTLTGEASGPVTRVEFMVDGQVVGGVDGRSGLWTWTALGVGRHTVVAVALGAGGERVESQPVIIRVE
jgi:1A family penicillin-binding protein